MKTWLRAPHWDRPVGPGSTGTTVKICIRMFRRCCVNYLKKLLICRGKNEARKGLKITLQNFYGKTNLYFSFKKEFLQGAKHLTAPEVKASCLKAIKDPSTKAKVSSCPDLESMIKTLDSHFRNHLEVCSKLFSEVKQLAKPGSQDFEVEI